MNGTRQAVLRDVTRVARGQSTRTRLRWRRLAARQFDAIATALASFVGAPLTPEVVHGVRRVVEGAAIEVERRHGRLTA